MEKRERNMICVGLLLIAYAYGLDGWSVPGIVCGAAAALCAAGTYDRMNVLRDFPLMCAVDLCVLLIIRCTGLQRIMPLLGYLCLVNTLVCLQTIRSGDLFVVRTILGTGAVSVLLVLAAAQDNTVLLMMLGTVSAVFLPMVLCIGSVYAKEFLKREGWYAKLTGIKG